MTLVRNLWVFIVFSTVNLALERGGAGQKIVCKIMFQMLRIFRKLYKI